MPSLLSAFRPLVSIRQGLSIPEAAVIRARQNPRYDGYRTDNAPTLSLYRVFPRTALSERSP
jgi:hypothetical protein